MDQSAAMDDPIDATPIRLRPYQQEMLDASIDRNIIVALDTGSGKTHIAIARILVELERCTTDKLVWFLAPSVALAQQQARVLLEHLPAYRIRTMIGADGVEKWTEQVLADALSHGFLNMSRLSLCIFDEAHHATKNHPYNTILKLFYQPARSRGEDVPHILGLSASPVVNSKKGSLEKIELSLNAIAVTPQQNREDLEKYVKPPQVISIIYSADDTKESDRLCNNLTEATDGYNFRDDPYIVEVQQQDDERSQKELGKIMRKKKTYTYEQLRGLRARAFSIHDELGPSMTRWYVTECITRFRDGHVSGVAMMPELSEKERMHLDRMFDPILKQANSEVHTDLVVTDKVENLVRILRGECSDETRGVIFVQQRAQVTALAELLRQTPDLAASFRIGTFVGTSASSYRKVSVADLADLRAQSSDLESFRNGEKNLMIATNVLEEGIDISACNLVICFEKPNNLVSFIQRRGRARRKDSKYFIFLSQQDAQKPGKQWAALEAQMKEAYMHDSREPAPSSEEDLSSRTYLIAATQALLTLENAKAHLLHFCSIGTSQASNYADLRPEFDAREESLRSWTATVDLPSFVHPDLRHAASSQAWPSETTAISDAAFEAYIALHKAGLVNDNLLPLIKDYGPAIGEQHTNQPSITEVAEQACCWRGIFEVLSPSDTCWHIYSVSLSTHAGPRILLQMWTPCPILCRLLQLYWNANTSYLVEINAESVGVQRLTPDQLALLQASTDLIMRSVHGARMASGRDYPVLFAPTLLGTDLHTWVDGMSGSTPVDEVILPDSSHPLDLGLVRAKGQSGRAYFFKSLEASPLEAATDERSIVVSTFPKRKDFLHPVAVDQSKGMAYTGMQCFKTAECTIDRLPAQYALFAAFAPSIIHRMGLELLAYNLQQSVLHSVEFSDASLVLDAMTAPAANEAADYNRLEYLGDSILKHYTELQVVAQHVNWPEAYLSAERDRMVRNSNLAAAALSLGLDNFIITKPFTGSKWCPPLVHEMLSQTPGTRSMSTKTLADVVEALIGAAYVDGGLAKAEKCIEVLLPPETWHSPVHCFDLLIAELRPTPVTNLDLQQRLIGHKFTHTTLLVEAITHVSFPYNRTGLSYERLEFLGDSVLDMIINPKLFAHPRNLKHWELHRIHEALVNSHFLGYCCMRYSIDDEVVVPTPNSKEHQIETSSREVHLHDFLRGGAQLVSIRRKATELFAKMQDEIDQALDHSSEYSWCSFVTLNPPKLFCDLVESVLGAIFIDTRGDLAACEAFVEKLGILRYMRRILDDHVETFSPKERIGVVADQDAVKYVNERVEGKGGERSFCCTLFVGEKEVVTVTGCGSKDEAEVKAAHRACELLGGMAGAEARRKKRKLAEQEDDLDEACGAEEQQ